MKDKSSCIEYDGHSVTYRDDDFTVEFWWERGTRVENHRKIFTRDRKVADGEDTAFNLQRAISAIVGDFIRDGYRVEIGSPETDSISLEAVVGENDELRIAVLIDDDDNTIIGSELPQKSGSSIL